MQAEEIKKILKNQEQIFTRDFGIEHLTLFGSYATNKQRTDSDIDLIYVMEPGTGMTLARLNKIEQLVSSLTGIRKIELVNKKYINPLVYLTASKHAIEIF